MVISTVDIKLVIFDIDGTLYDQPRLRKYMLFELIKFILFKPHKLKEVYILYHFRKERERNAFLSIPGIRRNQYIWCKEKTNASIERIKDITEDWLFVRPIKYLYSCSFKEAGHLIELLRAKNILTAVYSDYRIGNKMGAMKLSVDHVFSSEQKEIDALKPNPKGLNFISNKLNIDKKNILFIGDRMEVDGECAKKAGVKFMLVNNMNANTLFIKLITNLKSGR